MAVFQLNSMHAALRNKERQVNKSNSLMAIGHNLHRYFSSLRSDADIAHGESFKKSTDVFDEEIEREGKGDIVHKPKISKEHQGQLNKYFLSVIDTPKGLLQYVWYCIMMFLCKWEQLRDCFEVKQWEGQQFVVQVRYILELNYCPK